MGASGKKPGSAGVEGGVGGGPDRVVPPSLYVSIKQRIKQSKANSVTIKTLNNTKHSSEQSNNHGIKVN